MSDVGDFRIPSLGLDLDIRTDVPRYRVWRDGEVVEEPTDIMAHWRDDLVAFVLGCSFSFEEALMADDLPLRHIECGGARADVPHQHPMQPIGPVCRANGGVDAGPLKPGGRYPARCRSPSRFPSVHGAPVHLGHPDSIGIADISKPDYGDAVPIAPDEIPVFWACGVTPQGRDRRGQIAVRDHARAGADAGDRSEEQTARRTLMGSHFTGSACRSLRLYRDLQPFQR